MTYIRVQHYYKLNDTPKRIGDVLQVPYGGTTEWWQIVAIENFKRVEDELVVQYYLRPASGDAEARYYDEDGIEFVRHCGWDNLFADADIMNAGGIFVHEGEPYRTYDVLSLEFVQEKNVWYVKIHVFTKPLPLPNPTRGGHLQIIQPTKKTPQ